MRPVFLTDGRARRVRLNHQEIIFKHASPRQMATAGRTSVAVIRALRWLGEDKIDPATVATLRRRPTADDKRQLLGDLRYAPAWAAEIMREVTQPAHH